MPRSRAYSPAEIQEALLNAGLPPSAASTLTAISGAESSFGASPLSPPNKNGSRDHGVFQVNDAAHPQYGSNFESQPLDVQAKAAADIYNSREGPGAWVTYKTGAYKNFLGQVGDSTAPAVEGAVDPSIVAHGGTSPPIPGTSLTSSPASQIASKLFGGTGEDGKGLSPVEQVAKAAGGGDSQPQAPPPVDIAGQQAAGPMGMARQQLLAQQGQQLAAQWQQKAMQPMAYGGALPGSSAGLQDDKPMGQAVLGGQGIPLPPGMTLNSMGSLYG